MELLGACQDLGIQNFEGSNPESQSKWIFFFFFIESKVQEHRSFYCFIDIIFIFILWVPPICLEEELAFAWRPDIDVEPILMIENLINLLIYYDPPSSPWKSH
jgi:hypothetical protein